MFVPRTAPGDVARVRLDVQKRFARGELVSLDCRRPIASSRRARTTPIDRCGGCQLQHLSYDAQLEAKRRHHSRRAARIGRRDVGAATVEPSDEQWRYRRKLTLHCGATARRGSPACIRTTIRSRSSSSPIARSPTSA